MMWMLALTWMSLAHAAEVRLGVFVGNDEGNVSQRRLVFASADAVKMRDLFVSFGGISEENAILLQNEPGKRVLRALEEVSKRVATAKKRGDHTVLVFFYSGHGDEGALNLGTSRIAHDDLRAWVEGTDADLRVAFLDACQSGSIVRDKGGKRGPSYAFEVGAEETRGTAFLTSSARNEFSQESSELGGGFFTHYLHSGLQGAADANQDGDVSLTEAYAYVHTETSFATRTTAQIQTPTFDFDLTGSNDLWLTRLAAESAWLHFDGQMAGALSLWDETRKRYVAEIGGGRTARIAVRPGAYYVHHRMPGWVDEAAYEVAAGENITVSSVDFLTLAYEETASRGALKRQEAKAKRPDISVTVVGGARGFGRNSIFEQQYVPAHAVAGLQVRLLPRTGHLFFSADLLSGGGQASLKLPEYPEVRARIQSTSGAVSFGATWGRGLVRAGAGIKGEFISFRRHFDADAVPGPSIQQQSISFSPGASTWLGFYYGRLVIDLNVSTLYFPLQWDDSTDVPIYSELYLALGARF